MKKITKEIRLKRNDRIEINDIIKLEVDKWKEQNIDLFKDKIVKQTIVTETDKPLPTSWADSEVPEDKIEYQLNEYDFNQAADKLSKSLWIKLSFNKKLGKLLLIWSCNFVA